MEKESLIQDLTLLKQLEKKAIASAHKEYKEIMLRRQREADSRDIEKIKEKLQYIDSKMPPILEMIKKPDLKVQYVKFGEFDLTRIEVLQAIIETIGDIDKKDSHGDTLLHICCEKGFIQSVKYLIDQGADMDVYSDFWKRTPLVEARCHFHIDICKLLLKSGADPDLPSHFEREEGTTILHMSVQLDDLADLLLECGADIHLVDKEGFSALDYAYKRSEMIFCRKLIKLGAKSSYYSMREIKDWLERCKPWQC